MYYELSMDSKHRPYTYMFPYLQCPFAQNVIDVRMKFIWAKQESQRKKEANKKRKQAGNKAVFFNVDVG